MPSFGGVSELPVSSSSAGNSPAFGSVIAYVDSEIYEVGTITHGITSDIVYDIDPIPETPQLITSEIYELYLVGVTIEQEIPHYWDVATLAFITSNVFSTGQPVGTSVSSRIYELGVVSVSVDSVITELTYNIQLAVDSVIAETATLLATIQSNVYGASDGTQTDPAGGLIPAGLLSYGQATPVPGTPTTQTNYWTAQVILKGLDVSVNLTGTVMVDSEENAASVAEFTLKPTAGLVDLTQWVRAEVLIYYIPTDYLGNELSKHLLFNGFVNVPTYSPQTRLTTFTCTDELQKAFESKTTAQIDSVVGGFWSKEVFSEDTDKWSYAQDRLSTIPHTLDYDNNRVLVKTAWAAKGTPDYTLNEAVVIDGSVTVSLANSRSIVNTIDIESTYQYDTFKELSLRYSWSMAPSVKDGAGNYGIKTATFTHVIEAVQSAGWAFSRMPVFVPWPPTGYYAGVVIANVDREQVVGAYFVATKRYRQYVNDTIATKMYSPKSVASLGELKNTESFSLSAEYSEQADGFEGVVESTGSYEAELNTAFADDVVDGVPINPAYVGVVDVPFQYSTYPDDGYTELVNEGADILYDLSGALIANTRDDFESVQEVLQNLYKNTIVGSHRSNSVSVTMLMEPNITRVNTVRVDTYAVKATGKVRQVTHTLDINAGSALTIVSLAVSRSTGVGIPDVETPLDKTTVDPGVINPADVESYGLTTGTNFLGTWFQAKQGGTPTNYGMRAYYNSTEFLVNFPAIESGSVDEVTAVSDKEFIVNVPDEELTLNA